MIAVSLNLGREGSAASSLGPSSLNSQGGSAVCARGLSFPKEALAPDGRTISYRYRGYANGAELDRLANCVIPRSAMAVEMMDKRFG
ncbi:MAG: hypothetical protein M3434_09075, partial [Gemmatimonadota bacterium]|nr:hypothetical protein [Gemmatimonadota bacterium]